MEDEPMFKQGESVTMITPPRKLNDSSYNFSLTVHC